MEDSFLMQPWVTPVGIAILVGLGIWWFKFRPES